jgi:murein L,D-transpeptidase YafK
LLALTGVAFYRYGRSIWVPLYLTVMGRKTVDGAVAEFGDRADALLRPAFVQAGLAYPPKSAALLCFKQEKQLELWAKDDAGWAFVSDFEIKAASGKSGPKLEEGDRQVPEGIYRIEGLNPNSSFHVSMKLNYPNEFDVAHAKADGRSTLGGDIFIHGKNASVGCLAMGDEAAEALFVLAHRVGVDNVSVIIAPRDFRHERATVEANPNPTWLPELYADIGRELESFLRRN